MEPSIGRREASKRATRAAIEQAARELFAQRGFDAVTVREIAERAGVTERTFYRYFPSKHELVADDARAWAQVLRAAIRDRPRSEAPLEAVHLAVAALMRAAVQRPREVPVWLLHRRPRPFELLGQADQRALERFEQAIADGLRQRAQACEGERVQAREGERDADRDVELAARVAVAVIRTAAIRRLTRERHGVASDPIALLDEAFGHLVQIAGPSGRLGA